VGHDLRLSSLYDELRLEDFVLRPTSPGVFSDLDRSIDLLMTDPHHQDDRLAHGYREHLERARRNPEFLRAFLSAHGWEAQRWAA
jgi:hypothetical protein